MARDQGLVTPTVSNTAMFDITLDGKIVIGRTHEHPEMLHGEAKLLGQPLSVRVPRGLN